MVLYRVSAGSQVASSGISRHTIALVKPIRSKAVFQISTPSERRPVLRKESCSPARRRWAPSAGDGGRRIPFRDSSDGHAAGRGLGATLVKSCCRLRKCPTRSSAGRGLKPGDARSALNRISPPAGWNGDPATRRSRDFGIGGNVVKVQIQQEIFRKGFNVAEVAGPLVKN